MKSECAVHYVCRWIEEYVEHIVQHEQNSSQLFTLETVIVWCLINVGNHASYVATSCTGNFSNKIIIVYWYIIKCTYVCARDSLAIANIHIRPITSQFKVFSGKPFTGTRARASEWKKNVLNYDRNLTLSWAGWKAKTKRNCNYRLTASLDASDTLRFAE